MSWPVPLVWVYYEFPKGSLCLPRRIFLVETISVVLLKTERAAFGLQLIMMEYSSMTRITSLYPPPSTLFQKDSKIRFIVFLRIKKGISMQPA